MTSLSFGRVGLSRVRNLASWAWLGHRTGTSQPAQITSMIDCVFFQFFWAEGNISPVFRKSLTFPLVLIKILYSERTQHNISKISHAMYCVIVFYFTISMYLLRTLHPVLHCMYVDVMVCVCQT